MRSIQPFIDKAHGCEIVGEIYASENPDDLSEDMLEVVIPDGTLVCAGWSSIDGAYRITATRGLSHLRAPSITKDPEEAAILVEQWVAEFATQRPTRETDTARRN